MISKYLSILFLLFFYGATAQYTTIDSLVVAIDGYVEKIDANQNWTKIDTFQIENFNAKKTALVVHYQDDQVRKVILKTHNTYSESENIYYLQNDSLHYCLERNMDYIAPPKNNIHDTATDEFELYQAQNYFKGHILIRQTDNHIHGGSLNSQEYLKAAGASILDDFKVLVDLLETKDE
ncbi:MAG: hypothetical protein WBG90_01440 [Saonia sp.]